MVNENGSQNPDDGSQSQADPVGDLAHCPNCNGPGIRKGKTIACQLCNASFRYTKEGPKLVELGPFDELSARVSKLEGGTGFFFIDTVDFFGMAETGLLAA